MSEIITPEEIEQISKEVKTITNNLDIQQNGELEVSDWNSLVAATKKYMSLGLVPKRFTKPEEAAGAILFAKQLGVPPLQAIGQIALIHGKYAPFGTLFTALAQRDPDFGYDEVIYFNEAMEIISLENKNLKDPAWGCRVRTQKKGSPFIMETIWTMDDAKKADLIKNVWTKYPKDMIRWKCLARNYRTLYPAALEGVHMAEDLMTSWEPQEEKEVNTNGLKAFLEEENG